MTSKFLNENSAHAFEGTALEESFKTLLDLGWRKSEFAIVGSSALHFLSTASRLRGHDGSFLSRAPNDIDVLVVDNAKRHATDHGVRVESNIGRGYLVSLQLEENKGDLLDVTTAWPVGPIVQNSNGLRDITVEVDGLLVMRPSLIYELKSAFRRTKDMSDLNQQIQKNRASRIFRPGK